MTDNDSQKAFSPKVMVALVLVGIFAFSGFVALSAYAPDLRRKNDAGPHALSKSAVGFAGVVALLTARATPVVVSRAPLAPSKADRPLRVLTLPFGVSPNDLRRYDRRDPLLIVLPKWNVVPDELHPGWVRNAGLVPTSVAVYTLRAFGRNDVLHRRSGAAKPRLYGGGELFAPGTYLPLDRIQGLQTLSGPNWRPALVDETGRAVLARSRDGQVWVLSDPDILNNQGLKGLSNARAAMAILDTLRGDQGVAFDVGLHGFSRTRNPVKLLFEPPMLGAALCALAAALLMGVHAAVRFGPELRAQRPIAFGKRALIDNSADLIRAARKEHELAPLYARLTEARTARALGYGEVGTAERGARLSRLQQRRAPAERLEILSEAAARTRTRADVVETAARLFQWRSEMTRDRS